MENFLYNVEVDWHSLKTQRRASQTKGRKGEQMKTRNKLLALLLAMVMALGLMIPAAAAEGTAPADTSGKIEIGRASCRERVWSRV